MSASVSVLGSGAAPSQVPPALLLSFAQTRYLFGAGDGTQRMATEGHQKMAKLAHVFVPAIRHDAVGGLTGQTRRTLRTLLCCCLLSFLSLSLSALL